MHNNKLAQEQLAKLEATVAGATSHGSRARGPPRRSEAGPSSSCSTGSFEIPLDVTGSPRRRNREANAKHGAAGHCDKHLLAPIRLCPGYKGAKQQRCVICGLHCSWYCVGCSTPDHLVPLHPPSTGLGSLERTYTCLEVHEKNPGYFPKGIKENNRKKNRRHQHKNVNFHL